MVTVEVRSQPRVGCVAGAKSSGETCGLIGLCGGWKAGCWRATVPARVKKERGGPTSEGGGGDGGEREA